MTPEKSNKSLFGFSDPQVALREFKDNNLIHIPTLSSRNRFQLAHLVSKIYKTYIIEERKVSTMSNNVVQHESLILHILVFLSHYTYGDITESGIISSLYEDLAKFMLIVMELNKLEKGT